MCKTYCLGDLKSKIFVFTKSEAGIILPIFVAKGQIYSYKKKRVWTMFWMEKLRGIQTTLWLLDYENV